MQRPATDFARLSDTGLLDSSQCSRARQHLLACAHIEPPSKPVPVRIPPELVVRIDRQRGLVPREAYVRDLLDKALKRQERKKTRKS